jgi:predicted RNA-binding protein YlxR (DUF448 family)
VGCGRTAPKSELIRIAIGTRHETGAGPRRLAVLDRGARIQGRGAYVCEGPPGEPARACLTRAVSRGAIARALRCAVEMDPELIESVSR